METIDDYADRVERGARAAIGLAVHELRKCGTPMTARAAATLELLRLDLDAMLDDAMQADGLTTVTDQRDGLRYVATEAVAA